MPSKKSVTRKKRKITRKSPPVCLKYIVPITEEKKTKNILDNLTTSRILKTTDPDTKHYDPKYDFYSYVNYGWLKEESKKKEDKYYSQIDSFRKVQEKVNYELIDIIEEYIKTNNTVKSNNICSLYNSILHDDRSILKQHIHNTMKTIDDLVQTGSLLELLAELNKNEIVSWQSPVAFSVDKDEKNVSVCRCKINEPILTVYDYSIYVSDPNDTSPNGIYRRQFKRKYLSFINDLFDKCLGTTHGLRAEDVWDIENVMLVAMECDTGKEETEYYNKITTSVSNSYGLDWKQFSLLLGFKDPPSFYISGNPDYIRCIMKELGKNWKSPKWVTYYKFMYLKQMIMFDPKLYVVYYDFFKNYVEGSKVILPKKLRPIIPMSLCFNEMLTDEYVKKNEHENTIQSVKYLCKDLIEVFKNIITKNDWLSPTTKKYALLKLQHLSLIVSRPKIIQADPNIRYDKKDIWGNIKKITEWRYKKMLEREGQPSIEYSRIDWRYFKFAGKQSYIVNAFYTPTENNICIPLAYLQEPFTEPRVAAGIEKVLSTIGYTVAHEMSHSLDDMGSKYDYKGNMKNWWTVEDRKKFNKKIKDVIHQYETTALKDGIKLDGSLSTGENLADISGLAICTQYLQLYHKRFKYPLLLSINSHKSFQINIAIANRQEIYHSALKSQLKINPHPFNKYRTNCPLVRIKIFKKLWNIKEKDKMYWHSNDTIW